MANLICAANGNLTTLATWDVIEAGAGAVQTTRSASTNTTTSYVYSSAFTVTNTDVIDGLLLHCKRVNTTGTVSVTLSDDNGVTATREVTVNASDIPADQCWFFFKFASTLTGDGGADYKIGIKGSSAGNATFYRDGTAGNWTRLLRTTANPGALAAGDNFYIAGEWTAAATTTVRSVTMDALEGAITDFGTLDIGQGGTLIYGTSASTNYYLRLSGDLNVWSGGTLSIGTTGTPIPATSTAKLNLDCGSNVQYGITIQSGGAFNGQGATKTISAILNADIAVNTTNLTTNISTSWADNDEIAIASTSRTYTECEKGALNGAASGTSLTVDGFGGVAGGVAYAHLGIRNVTFPLGDEVSFGAEIVNLTRNIKIFGASSSLQTYVFIASAATVDLDYCEFYWLGSATANKRGIDITTNTGTTNIQYCSFHDFSVSQSIVLFLTIANNTTISNNVSFNSSNYFVYGAIPATSTVSNNIALLASESLYYINSGSGVFSNNTAAGSSASGPGIYIDNFNGTFNNNESHSCAAQGIYFNNGIIPSTIIGLKCWRNATLGIVGVNMGDNKLTWSKLLLFGNLNNLQILTGRAWIVIKNSSFHGDTSFSTTSGLIIGSPINLEIEIENTNFGTSSGVLTTHTYDINISGSYTNWVLARLQKVTLNSATKIYQLSSYGTTNSFIKIQRLNGTAGNHISYFIMGTISTDTTIYNTASPSERLTPSSTSTKLESSPRRVTVLNAATKTFTVNVRKSVVGDGAAYNGNEPRLILRKNPALGINDDVVLDTMTAAAGNWEALSGTTAAVNDDGVLEAYVDCDGTAGWINVDDWSA